SHDDDDVVEAGCRPRLKRVEMAIAGGETGAISGCCADGRTGRTTGSSTDDSRAADLEELPPGSILRAVAIAGHADKPIAGQREELAVRPRTIPTNASTSSVVRSRGQASATVESGPSTSGR